MPSLGSASPCWRGAWPAQPDLRNALERLSPEHARRHVDAPVAGEPTQRLGAWGLRVLPPAVWGRTPTAELAILRKPVTRFYGEKVSFALLGLVIPPVLTSTTLFGADLPVPVPWPAAWCWQGCCSWSRTTTPATTPNAPARSSAGHGAYIDLVALERHNGSGPRQAMEAAAAVGDSWVFQRLSEELARHPLVRPDPVGVPASPRR